MVQSKFVHDEEDPDPREYKASALCHVAGCEQTTLRAWRRRNGLFPETMKSRKWNLFSLADMRAAKLVVDLTSVGVAAQRAVDIAMQLLPTLEEQSTGRAPSWTPPTEAQLEAKMIAWCAINFVIKENAQGKILLKRYDRPITIANLMEAEGHPGALLVINLANVMELPLDRLSKIGMDEIDRPTGGSHRRATTSPKVPAKSPSKKNSAVKKRSRRATAAPSARRR